MARDLKQVSATGDVVTQDAYLHSVVLTPAAAASSVVIRDGASGAVRLTLNAVANGASVVWTAGDNEGVFFTSAIHATLSGAAAVASLEFS